MGHELEQGELECVDAGSGRGRDAEHADDPLVLDVERRRLGAQIGLVQDDHLRSFVQSGAVRGELSIDRVPTLRSVAFRGVDHMQQQPRALEMRKELVPQADTLARSLDQSRHVGDDQLPAVGRLDRAEVRRERREWILRDLRPCVRDARQERRLPRVGQSDERRIGKQLQAQLNRAFFPRHADLGEAWRLPGRRRITLVAMAAAAALGHDDPRAGPGEVCDQTVFLVEYLGADRHREHCVLSVGTVRELPAARAAPPCPELLIRADACQIAALRIRDEHDVAAPATVAAVGPAFGDELLAPEVDRAVAAATGDHCQLGAIVEHRRMVPGTHRAGEGD